MKKIRANDLIVMYMVNGRWKAIAFATSCEIDISADTIETSSPDTGRWKTYKKRKKGWKISTAHLMGNVKKTPDLFDLLESDEPIQVCMTTVEAHPGIIEHTEYKQDGKYQLVGEALVVRMTVTARKGDMVTMSAELLGNGRLINMAAPWVFVNGLWNNTGVWKNDEFWK
jgi:predicted secreted protein